MVVHCIDGVALHLLVSQIGMTGPCYGMRQTVNSVIH